MLWLLDLDGVVWLAGEPIPGSAGAVAQLRRRGDAVAFTTNNAHPTIAEYMTRLARCGIEAGPGDLVTSAQAAASLLEPGSRAFLCAGPGVEEALVARGVEAIPLRDREPRSGEPRLSDLRAGEPHLSALVVGYHLDFGYQTLSIGARLVREGAAFIGTNDDATYPTPGGLLAGTGALLAAFATASGRSPTLAGKPHAPMAALVSERFGIEPLTGAGEEAGGHSAPAGTEEDEARTITAGATPPACTVVGDRPSTDGLFARRLGARFVLVESGVTPPGSDIAMMETPPDLVVPDLAAAVHAL